MPRELPTAWESWLLGHARNVRLDAGNPDFLELPIAADLTAADEAIIVCRRVEVRQSGDRGSQFRTAKPRKGEGVGRRRVDAGAAPCIARIQAGIPTCPGRGRIRRRLDGHVGSHGGSNKGSERRSRKNVFFHDVPRSSDMGALMEMPQAQPHLETSIGRIHAPTYKRIHRRLTRIREFFAVVPLHRKLRPRSVADTEAPAGD